MSKSEVRYIPHNTHGPSLPTDLDEVREDLRHAIQLGVERIHRHPSPKPGVYIGAGGHLLMNWRLADTLAELHLATVPVEITSFPLDRPAYGASFLETNVGTAALIIGQHLRNPSDATAAKFKVAVRLVRDAIQAAIDEEPNDDGCEVLYGRAGLLYAILFLRTQLDRQRAEELDELRKIATQLVSDDFVRPLVDDIVVRGKLGANEYISGLPPQEHQLVLPLMWRWHGKRYLGGAHGVAGILQMLLSAPSKIIAPHWDAILGTVKWLLSIQQPSGNWPHKASEHAQETIQSTHDELVQWCHGAPGVLILLSTLICRYGPDTKPLAVPEPTITAARSALARGGQLVYSRGMLRKGVGLCHGVSGSVYALLAVAAALDEHPNGEWFMRAVHLSHLACAYETLTSKGEMTTPDRPYSLYEGVAGMCCAWADVLKALEGTSGLQYGMPGYSDLDQL